MSEYIALTPDGKYLLHYGVKDMKWGKKKRTTEHVTTYSGLNAFTKENPSADYNTTDTKNTGRSNRSKG